ncbi:hypothetical protein [uncultured Alistipes sp.]|uniref:hypothetical protein n=1 Tax=uncultured Alistipes sp. TaxID=538949 RepID=UPI002582E6CB|nr:hypothetical protein [uncultured Alistipes sp.]
MHETASGGGRVEAADDRSIGVAAFRAVFAPLLSVLEPGSITRLVSPQVVVVAEIVAVDDFAPDALAVVWSLWAVPDGSSSAPALAERKNRPPARIAAFHIRILFSIEARIHILPPKLRNFP